MKFKMKRPGLFSQDCAVGFGARIAGAGNRSKRFAPGADRNYVQLVTR